MGIVNIIVIALMFLRNLVNGFKQNIFSKVSNTCPSEKINLWRVKMPDNKIFYITPAHVAIHSKNQKWLISEFLNDVRNWDWKIPKTYAEKPSSDSDLCWCEETPDNQNSEILTNLIITSNSSKPVEVDIYFRQPFDLEGAWIETPKSLGVTQALLYDTPTKVENEAVTRHYLLEALDVGFRGMSGAVAVKRDTAELAGIFVKRGALIPFKEVKATELIEK